MLDQIRKTLQPETLTVIKDYYHGWFHKYRTVERICKLEKCDGAKALLLIKLFRTTYKVW